MYKPPNWLTSRNYQTQMKYDMGSVLYVQPRFYFTTKDPSKKTALHIMLMISLLPSTTNSLDEISFSDLFTTGEVTRSDLGVDFDTRVRRQEVVRDIVSFDDRNARLYNCIVFPVWSYH